MVLRQVTVGILFIVLAYATNPSYVSYFNYYRKLHGLNDLVYDSTVAGVAQAFATSMAPTGGPCSTHSSGTGYGENLAWQSSGSSTPDESYLDATQNWCLMPCCLSTIAAQQCLVTRDQTAHRLGRCSCFGLAFGLLAALPHNHPHSVANEHSQVFRGQGLGFPLICTERGHHRPLYSNDLGCEHQSGLRPFARGWRYLHGMQL